MTPSQKKAIFSDPIFLCINFENSLIRLSKTGKLADDEILFGKHERVYSEEEFTNILSMLHIQKVKLTDESIAESRLFIKERPAGAIEILTSFKNNKADTYIFSLKRTYEKKYLSQLKQMPLIVLAKVTDGIEYFKHEFELNEKTYNLVTYFTDSNSCKKFCETHPDWTIDYKPLVTTIEKTILYVKESEGIFINPEPVIVAGKDLSLAFLSKFLKETK